jgi:hypothetical protein
MNVTFFLQGKGPDDTGSLIYYYFDSEIRKKKNQATEFKALFLKTKLSPIIVMTQHQKGWSESFIQHSFSSNIGESKGT